MTATVRSVRVVLEAEIAKYVADMKTAGRATKDAFDGAGRAGTDVERSMGRAEKSTEKAGTSARRAGDDFDGMGAKARAAGREVDDLGNRTGRAGREIDRMSGRVRILGEALVLLGPAAVPLTAGVIPALTGLAGIGGSVAAGVGVTVLALKGLGDAQKALNDYQLSPTEAHLQKLQQEMGKAGRTGAQFVRFLDGLGTDLKSLQLLSRNRMLPGMESGLTSVMKLLPEARHLVSGLSHEVGQLSAEAGAALAGGEWAGFIDYLGTDAVPMLDTTAHTLGNLLLGTANLLAAFAPATRDFTHGLDDAARSYANWSANLDDNEKFQDFLDYVRREGPEVVDLLQGLGSMLLGVAHAAAPVGEAMLPTLTAVAEVIGEIGDSPIGPLLYTTAAGLLAVSRASKIAESAMGRFQTTTAGTRSSLLGVGKSVGGVLAVAAAVGALGTAMANATGAKLNLSDLDRNLQTISDGGGHATLNRLSSDFDKLHASITDIGSGKAERPLYEVAAALGSMVGFGDGNSPWDNAANNIDAVDEALAQMVESGNAEQAKKIFDDIVQSIAGGSVPGGSVAPDLMKQITGSFNSYTIALENAGIANGAYTRGLGAAQEAAGKTSAEIDGLVESMRNQRTAALEAFDAETQWRQALKDAAKQGKESNAGINGSSDAALANREALSKLAAAWNGQSDAVKNSRARFREARAAFIRSAESMGVPTAAAKRLARQLLEIPRSRVTDVTVNTGPASAALRAYRRELAALNGYTAHTFVQVGVKGKLAGMAVDRQADGGTVQGQRYPYGDKTFVLAAPGEEIITNRNGEADRFRADRAAGRIPAYADGGTVGRIPRYAAGGTITAGIGGLGDAGRSQSRPGYAAEIADMTVRQIHRLGDSIDDLSTRRLAKLGTALERATKIQEKQSQAAQQAFEDVQSRRAGYASDISQSLTRDIFGTGGSAFQGQYAAGSLTGATQQLNLQGQDARDMERLERILQERGLHGGALQEVLAGGIDRVRMAAAAPVKDLLGFQQAYDSAQASTTRAANTGAALLTPEFNGIKAESVKQTRELRAINQELRAQGHEVQQRHEAAQREKRRTRQAAKRARRNR